MLACGRCMKSGKIIHRFYDDDIVGDPVVSHNRPPVTVSSGQDIVEGYGQIIKSAREKSKLPLSVVAERVSEKESYLHALENERLRPTIEVAKKLEKELNVKLIEEISEAQQISPAGSSKSFSEPTLADMLIRKKEK